MNKAKKVIAGLMAALTIMGAAPAAAIVNIESPAAVTASAAVTKPAQVTGLKVSKKAATSVTLTWSAASGAQKYHVFKYDSKTGKYAELGSTTAKSYTVKNLKANTKYTFAVQATKTIKGKNYWGKVSSKVTVTTPKASVTPPAQVTGVKASNTKADSVKLSWNTASGAQKYHVFKYNSSTGKYTELGATKEKTYTVKKLKANTKYIFIVQATKTVDGKVYWGKMSAKVTVTTAKAASSSSSTNWKKLYKAFLEKNKFSYKDKDTGRTETDSVGSYYMLDINKDGVMEMIGIDGEYGWIRTMYIFTIKNGKVVCADSQAIYYEGMIGYHKKDKAIVNEGFVGYTGINYIFSEKFNGSKLVAYKYMRTEYDNNDREIYYTGTDIDHMTKVSKSSFDKFGKTYFAEDDIVLYYPLDNTSANRTKTFG